MGRRRARSKREGEGSGSKRRRASLFKEDEIKKAKGKGTGGRKATEISKPDAAAGSGGIVHPLLIPHVIEKIFQLIICPKTAKEAESSSSVVKNVKNLRLVCKQWKDSATRLYRRNRAPMMKFGMSCLDQAHYTSPDKKMQNFLDVMKSSDMIPIQRYKILDKFFVKENEQLMMDFMRICGPDAVELIISCYNSSRMKFTRKSFPDLNLMNLKMLSFECGEYMEATARAPHENACLIEALLSATETLHEFKYYEFSRVAWKWSQAMIQRFGESISKRLPKTVKILRLHMPLNDLHLITLAESELKLEEFHFYVGCGASSMVIHKFFETQAPTLKILNIDGSLSSSESLAFPRFHELLHLRLELKAIRKFSWPDTFPKLSSLNIAMWDTESTCAELFSSTKKGLSLKEIELSHHFPQAPFVKNAAQLFPNISKFHIAPTLDISETLQKVFVYFPNLEELYISVPFLDNELDADSVFSGVSEQDCRRIRNADNFDSVNLRDFQHLPSILNLTKLKKLILFDETLLDTNVILTDFTAHFVFLKMVSLNELHTLRFRISTKYLGLLREKLTLKLNG